MIQIHENDKEFVKKVVDEAIADGSFGSLVEALARVNKRLEPNRVIWLGRDLYPKTISFSCDQVGMTGVFTQCPTSLEWGSHT